MKHLNLLCDGTIYLFYGYRAFINFKERSNYSTCAAPIQIFLVTAPPTLMIMSIILHLLEASTFIPRMRKYLNIFAIFILNPFCFYLLVQGTIWQMIIRQKSPSCPTGISETPWIWAFLLFCSGIAFTHQTYLFLKEYWQTRITLNQLAEHGDDQRVNQILLELGSVENNQIRLLSSEIFSVEKRNSYEENCPICLMEFNGEEKIVTLANCRHIFHAGCVVTWLQNKPSCPMCRGSVRNGMMSIELQAVKKNRYRPPNDVENPE